MARLNAIVVETQKEYAVVLSRNGRFIRVRNDGAMRVGHETEVSTRPFKSIARMASVAAVLILVMGLGCGACLYSLPYSYVDIDINPSMGLTMNVFDRIIGFEGFNDAGADIVSGLDLKYKSLEDAIRMVMARAKEKQYMREDEDNTVSFIITSKNDQRAEKLSNKIIEVAQPVIADQGETSVTVQKVEIEENLETKENEILESKGISSGDKTTEKITKEKPEKSKPDKAADAKNTRKASMVKITKNSGQKNKQDVSEKKDPKEKSGDDKLKEGLRTGKRDEEPEDGKGGAKSNAKSNSESNSKNNPKSNRKLESSAIPKGSEEDRLHGSNKNPDDKKDKDKNNKDKDKDKDKGKEKDNDKNKEKNKGNNEDNNKSNNKKENSKRINDDSRNSRSNDRDDDKIKANYAGNNVNMVKNRDCSNSNGNTDKRSKITKANPGKVKDNENIRGNSNKDTDKGSSNPNSTKNRGKSSSVLKKEQGSKRVIASRSGKYISFKHVVS